MVFTARFRVPLLILKTEKILCCPVGAAAAVLSDIRIARIRIELRIFILPGRLNCPGVKQNGARTALRTARTIFKPNLIES